MALTHNKLLQDNLGQKALLADHFTRKRLIAQLIKNLHQNDNCILALGFKFM